DELVVAVHAGPLRNRRWGVRRKAVGLGAQRAQETRIGEANGQAREQLDLLAAQRQLERLVALLEEGRIRWRRVRHGGVVDLDLNAEPFEQRLQLLLDEAIVLTGQRPDIAGQPNPIRNAVALDAGL